MSAPNTNISKEAERHRGPLTGMTFAVVFALVLLGAFLIWTRSQGGDPAGAEAQVDGRTGDVEATEAAEGAPATDTVTNDAAAAATDAAADPAASTVAPAATEGSAADGASEGTSEAGTGAAAEPAASIDGEANDDAASTNP